MEITGDLLVRRVGMFLKGMKLGLPFIKKEGVMEEDIDRAEEAGVDVAAAADALLTPMGDVGGDRVVEPVNIPQPLLIDGDDREIVEEADALLTPMGDGAVNAGQVSAGGNVDNEITLEGIVDEENKDELKDVFESSPEAEASGGKGKDDFMSGLFDQEEEEEESPVQMLIASLPDIALEEVVNAADEVKTLMLEWQQGN
jgi:hypothetical protein